MKLSARNKIKGKVKTIVNGIVTANVTVAIGGGNVITAVISTDAIDDLKLKKGDAVTVVIKSTDVMIGKG